MNRTAFLVLFLFVLACIPFAPATAGQRPALAGPADSLVMRKNLPSRQHDFLSPGALRSGPLCASLDRLPDFAFRLLPDTSFASTRPLHYRVFHYQNGLQPGTRLVSDDYCRVQGVLTFRGGFSRDLPVAGRVTGSPTKITEVWQYTTNYDTTRTQYGRWGGGMGWTGQPLLVSWPDAERRAFAQMHDQFAPRMEVIAGSLSGEVYFLDMDTGTETRKPIRTGNPVKGTPMLDPRLNGLLYVGDGVPHQDEFGIHLIDLHRHEPVFFFSGHEDVKAYRRWGAFDSSPLLVGDYVYWPGENGILYKFLVQDGVMHLVARMVYHVRGEQAAGVESSLAVHRNYGYFADNHGNILCVNLLTMKPVWRYDNRDDTDATLVLDVEGGIPYLYSGSEVDRQGKEGYSRLVKLHGLDGSLIWENKVPAYHAEHYGREFPGGMFATPLLGRKQANGMLYVNIAHLDEDGGGALLALDTSTGEILFQTPLQAYSWSSPAGFYNEAGELVVFTADAVGNIYLLDGSNGQVLFRKRAGRNFEASPAIWGNSVIIGSRGREIYRFDLE